MIVPTESGLRAACDWWRTLTEHERAVFSEAGLDPVRWWTSQDGYSKAADAWRVAHGDQEAGEADYWWRFALVDVVGGMEAWGWRKANWGDLVAIRAMRQDDPYPDEPFRLLVLHRPDSPFRRRMEQRRAMQAALPRRWRALVNSVRSRKLSDWLADLHGGEVTGPNPHPDCRGIGIDELRDSVARGERRVVRGGRSITSYQPARPEYAGLEEIIRRRLGLDARGFWRCARGLDVWTPPFRQLELFT